MELPFIHPLVRDLAWVMASPSLLADATQVVSNDACQEIYNNNIGWLVKLDEQPELLLAALEQQKSQRLGYYFEHLVAFWVQQRLADENFASHVRVFEEKRTLGEFDFLFTTIRSNQSVHWETAVKFYLHYQAKDENVWWYGPNAQDRLDIKLDRVFNHQLKLGESPQGRALLKEKGFENVQSQTFFKGYLFYPVTSDWHNPQPLPPIIAPGHLKGWWARVNELDLPVYDSGDRWVVLPKMEWLAPKVVNGGAESRLMDTQQLIEFLREHFDHGQQSLLLAQMVRDDHCNWCERTRGFVVSSAWPNQ